MSLTIAPPRFPDPPDRFDRGNEAQFRRALERAILDIQQAAGSGGAAARGSDALTTASIADLAETTGVWDIGCSAALLLSMQSDKGARVRLYSTAAARTADSARGLGTDPTAGSGVLCEFVFTGASTIGAEPPIILKNMDGAPTNEVYYAIQNRSGSTGTVTATALLLVLEA